MTNPYDARQSDARGVDTDRVDGGSRLWRPAAAAIVVGLAVGAVAGGLIGAAQSPSYEATTALSVLPDSVIDTGEQNSTTPTLDATAYIQGQLVGLNGAQVADAVQRRLHLPATPSVTATQVGQTYVVDVTATAGSQAQAKNIATATGAVYAQQRSSALTRSIKASLRSTNSRVVTVRKNLAAAQRGAKPGAGVTPSQTALQTEYERLLTLSSSLDLALPQVSQLVTVQSPAHVVPKSISSVVLGTGIGALAGAIIGVIALIAYRRFSPRVRSVGDIVELDVPVLLPVVPRAGRSVRKRAWRSSPVRLVGARLAAQADQHVLVVVGATARVGASYIAAGLAGAAAPRGPVLLIKADNGGRLDSSRDRGSGTSAEVVASAVPGVWLLPGAGELAGADAHYGSQASTLVDVVQRAVRAGWFVVVDAPALADSDLALDCLRAQDSVATLVVARSVSRPAEILGAAELLETTGRFAGAVLNEVPRTPLRRRSGSGGDVATVRNDAAITTVAEAVNEQSELHPARDTRNTMSHDDNLIEDHLAQQRDPVRDDDTVVVPPRT